MDKNDPFNRSGGHEDADHEEHEFNDDVRYDDARTPGAREEEYVAGQEEWEQPIDEFAQETPQEGGRRAPPKNDPFAEEEPLEDDFSEHEHDLHEHDEQDGTESADQPSAAAARSGSASQARLKQPSGMMKMLPYVGAGLAAVVIAFFGYQQFMMGDMSPPPAQPSLENQNTWDAASAHPAQPSSQPVAQEFQQPAPSEQPASRPVEVEASQPTAAQPVEQQPSAQMITPVVASAQNAPSSQQAGNPLEARINELTQQLEAMKQTQEQLNQKLQTAVATPPSMDESSKAASRALEDRIAQLEQKVTTQSATSPGVEEQPASAKPVRKASQRARRVDNASTDFIAAKKSSRAKKHASPSVDVNSTSGTEGVRPTNSRPFQGWILRSAQPGSAWLSQGATSSDLRRVVPGDKVQGLGTVTAIRQVAGRWVVEGTQGAVR